MSGEVQSADDFVFREVTAADGETMIELAESNPDGGEIQFAPHFEVNPYEAYSELVPTDDFVGFMAETPGGDEVGMGMIAFNDARIGGKLQKRGYLAGLIVDHEYRGIGLGKQLAAKRVYRRSSQISGFRPRNGRYNDLILKIITNDRIRMSVGLGSGTWRRMRSISRSA